MYFKRNLCLRQIDISFFPDECILCQININNKKASITVFLYRSPSQTSSEFNIFQYNLDKILNDVKQLGSSYLIMLVDFNAKSKTWWTNITTSEDFDIWFAQLISNPTHILPNSSSCIDLIFTDQTNLEVDTGVHLSLHPNYHHQITYCKFSLFIKYPTPYE